MTRVGSKLSLGTCLALSLVCGRAIAQDTDGSEQQEQAEGTEDETGTPSDSQDPPPEALGPTDESAGEGGPSPDRADLTTPRVEPTARRETLPGFYPEALGMFKGKGVWFGTPDRRYVMRMSGFIHFDSRFTSDFDGDYKEDQVFFRRVRIALDGRFLGDFEYRLMWDTLIDPLSPYDWHIDWRPRHELNLRVGGFKDPFSLERRMRSFALLFSERTFTNALSPNRGMGGFVYGQTEDGFFSYEASVTSGAANGETRYYWRGSPDLAGRVYFLPFRRLAEDKAALHHLGFGASFTIGEDFGDAERTGVAGIRPPSRGTRLFGYRGGEDPVVVNGIRDRQALQFHWQYDQWQAMAELTRSAHRVSLDSVARRDRENTTYLANYAWHILGSYTHNKNDENRFYGVSPAEPFSLQKRQWGGFTSSVRYTQIFMDPASFPLYADPDANIRSGHGFSYSFQWHVNSSLEFQVDGDLSLPIGGAPQGANLPPEVSLGTRVEFRY